MLDRPRADVSHRLLMGRLQRGTDFLLEIGDAAERDLDAEDVVSDLFDAAFADAVTADEIGEHGGEAFAQSAAADRCRNGRLIESAAVRTGASMSLVLGDAGRQLRQFGDLVPKRSDDVVGRHGGKIGPTTDADVGHERDDSIDALGGNEFFEMRRMSGLTAAFSAGGLLGGSGRHAGGTTRRIGPFVELASEAGDPSVPATNWMGEQVIRSAVVNRKVWGGNRTDVGAEAQSITMSVLETCRRQTVDAMSFVSQTLRGVAAAIFPYPRTV